MLIVVLTVRCLSGFDSLSYQQCCVLLAVVGQESFLEVELTEFSMCCSCSPLLQCWEKASVALSSEIWLLSSLDGASGRSAIP